MGKIISHEEISSLCMELSLLLHAGVGVGDGFALLLEECDAAYKELLSGMARQVDEGLMILTLLSAKKMVSPLLWNAIPVPSGCYSKIKSVRSMRSTMRDLCEE